MRTFVALSVASVCLLGSSLASADDKAADPPPQVKSDDPAFDPNSYTDADKPKAKTDGDAADGGDTDKPKKKKKKGGDEDGEDEEGDEGPSKKAAGEDEGRFRGGVSGAFGPFFPGPIYMFGADGRLGYQINDLRGVYGGFGAMAGFGIGVGTSDNGGSASISAGAALALNAMFEVTLADIFFVGLGPQLMYGSFATASVFTAGTSAGTAASVFSGPLGGIKARIGVGFGANRPGRRKQFTLAIDGNLIFGERLVATEDVSGSGAAVTVSDGVGVGFLPMLSLGYDAK